MLRILFICQCKPLYDAEQIKAIQRDIWRRCGQKKIGGFLVRNDRTLVGLFEGTEKIVIGEVESLIRKSKVHSVQVLQEVVVESRDWPKWNSQYDVIEDVPQAEALNLAGLAQNVMDAVEADQYKN